jgi:hypothetical protein
MEDWKERNDTGLDEAIGRLKRVLPGWWYSVCECQVSIECRVAPTVESPHIALIEKAGDDFDAGFEACHRQPSSPANVLHEAIDMAYAAVMKRAENTG